ncbi:MAG: penicillin-binding protein 2 [Acidobacteria bacterium]|nr:penicillin-binding protein 2 [Acidobacteriota bacterium]MBI3661446.1 penicillin-binding protein 2 [Acidobacteriota bacterium]
MSYWIGNDQKLPQARLSVAQYVIAGITLFLLIGFWKLQIIQSDYYAQLAERNSIRSIPIIAPRGRMLDREGRVLVDNYPSFSVLLLREDAKLLTQNLPVVAEGLGVPLEEIQQQVDASKNIPKFQPILIKPEATPADIAFIESHRADLPLLELLMVHRRRYPRDGFMAHAIGYVGEVSEKQIEASGGKLRPGDFAGKSGLERQYNETLMGSDGLRRVIVNSVGKEVGRLEHTEATPGKPIKLTIDYDLQVVAEAAMAGQKGAVVAVDPRTGEVLAMTSHPAPDPNAFAVRISREEWKRLNEDEDRPLLNRVIQAQLAPGSVFKVVMSTAMLESKLIPEDFSVYCPGYADFYGRMFKCHVFGKGGHGQVELHKAVVQSCDVFFYNVGKRLGIDRISYYAYQLGLGRRTGIDLPGEENGLVPSEEWKKRVFKQPWYAGETISVAVGQGATVTTPLQLARTVGGIALGGVFKQPHLLLEAKNVKEEDFPISENTTEKVTQAMFGVVNEGGTAAASRLEGIEFCGKTGTAQLISGEGLKKAGKQRRFTDNAWFVGYAPRRNPEIVVAVLVEHGVHGSTAAAPVARDIIKAYYDKKGAREKKQFTVDYRRYDLGAQPDVAQAPVAGKPETDAAVQREAGHHP